MSSPLWVSTLMAPKGAVLYEAQIENFRQRVLSSGGLIEKTAFPDPGRTADIFFIGGQAPIGDLPYDVITQPASFRRKKILLADMESTIIEQEMLDEMANLMGHGEATAAITRRAMNGELDFVEALRERVALLKGQPESLLYQAANRMTFTPGARELVAAMKAAGAKCWLVSGGFAFFVKRIAELAGFDRYFANELIVENGVLTGEVEKPILDKAAKQNLLVRACMEYKCNFNEALTVGDGANDVPMLQACVAGGGLGVAFKAKPKVREVIHNQINHGDLSALIDAQDLKS